MPGGLGKCRALWQFTEPVGKSQHVSELPCPSAFFRQRRHFPTRVGFFRPLRLFLPYRQKCQDPGFFHGEKNARALAFLPKEKMPAFWYFFEGCWKPIIPTMSEKADTCRKKLTLVGKSRHLSEKPD